MASVRHPAVTGRQINADDYDDEHIVELEAADVTDALGYTPANTTDLAGYATDGDLAAEAAARAAADSALDAAKAPVAHTHDDRYYTETEVDALIAGVGGGAAWQLQFGALVNEAPASNPATLDTRNGRACLDFDAGTDEAALWTAVLPASYAGGGLHVDIYWTAESATSGNCIWNAAIERTDLGGLDIDADSFAAAQATTTAAPGTSGQMAKTRISFSNGSQMDSLAASEVFRLKVSRDADNASDTMAGDAEVYRVVVLEQ